MFDIGSSYLFHVKVKKSVANFGKKKRSSENLQGRKRKGGGKEEGRRR